MTVTKQETTYSEAIEKVLRRNGYYAPLQVIYAEFERYRPFSGRTPLKTIQERVQRDKRFTRIGVGVYALTEYLDKLPHAPKPRSEAERKDNRHARIQGMIIELGNMTGFKTYTRDRSKVFDNKQLGNLVTLKEVPDFTYPRIVQSVRFIDVVWFNERGFPARTFEVEDSTDFRGSLLRFADLQDFSAGFRIVAPSERKERYEREVGRAAFESIRERCQFVAYARIQRLYKSGLEYFGVQQAAGL